MMNAYFTKKLNWTKTYRTEFDLIKNVVLFGSGTSVSAIPQSKMDAIKSDPTTLLVTLNYGQKVIDSHYNFMTDREPIHWAFMNLSKAQLSRCIAHKTNVMDWIPYYFAPRDFNGRKSNFTLVNAIMAIKSHEQLGKLPLWIYGLDLYVKQDAFKYYDVILKGDEDQNMSRKTPQKFFDSCESDLNRLIVDRSGIYNCNMGSGYGGFEFKEFK